MKRSLTLVHRFLTTVAFIACSQASFANWALSNKDSVVSFVSVKNTSIAEVHTFKKLSGNIDSKGKAMLAVDLNSVHTLIPIRDERMRDMLFQTKMFPTATLTANIDTAPVKQLKPGDSLTVPLTFTLDLHGKKTTAKTDVNVVVLNGKRLQVTTISPLILNAADFGLVKGVNELREIAGLKTISTSVMVSAQLVFAK